MNSLPEAEAAKPAARVILYGNSVFLAGIKAELQSHELLDLVTIDPGCANPAEQIGARNPDAVIFDLGAGQPDFALSLIRKRPGLLLIGLHPGQDELLILSGREAPAVTATDVMRVILEEHPGAVVRKPRGLVVSSEET
jgi:hypothetical protein